MTESPFNYSSLTLEELRTLAASPQVGAIEAMPHAFRHLATQVGEVAELLSRAQADLPNWWKGPAAEQAAAALGRAAAEAHGFHDSALNAATAVGRCATIVAEQQHQMMSIPELPEPGVTAIIEPPKTPMDALEAARQDVAYQAARERAVQVVNGIAAQYVETRERLATISMLRGEGFSPANSEARTFNDEPITSTSPPGSHSTETMYEPPAHSDPIEMRNLGEPATDAPASASRIEEVHYMSGEAKVQNGTLGEIEAERPEREIKRSSVGSRPHLERLHAYENHLSPTGTKYRPSSFESALLKHQASEGFNSQDWNGQGAGSAALREPTALREPPALREPWGHNIGSEASDLGSSSSPSRVTPAESHQSHEGGTYSPIVSTEYQTAGTQTQTENAEKPAFGGTIGNPPSRRRYSQNGLPEVIERSWDRDPSLKLETDGDQRRTVPAINLTRDNPPMIPPFTGTSSIRRERDSRNPRPSYLKERSSVWLTEAWAAPPDGIITPEWFEGC